MVLDLKPDILIEFQQVYKNTQNEPLPKNLLGQVIKLLPQILSCI